MQYIYLYHIHWKSYHTYYVINSVRLLLCTKHYIPKKRTEQYTPETFHWTIYTKYYTLNRQSDRPSKSKFSSAGKIFLLKMLPRGRDLNAMKTYKPLKNFVKLCKNHKKVPSFPVLRFKVLILCRFSKKIAQAYVCTSSTFRSSVNSIHSILYSQFTKHFTLNTIQSRVGQQ